MFDLKSVLPQLLPGAIAWAENESQQAAANGRPLTALECEFAKIVGVRDFDSVSVSEVDQLPLPEQPALRAAALATGLIGPQMAGLTLGHTIFVIRRHLSNRLISHELRHVYQYEQLGSIAKFLPVYLEQIATVGYENAPLEIDARKYEIR
jgi:hypothetical protein